MSLVNVVVLIYIAWVKYIANVCPTCSQLLPIRVSGVGIALSGLAASIILALTIYLSNKIKLLQIISLVLAGICSTIALYLQLIQSMSLYKICWPCAVSLKYGRKCFSLVRRARVEYPGCNIPYQTAG